MKCNKKPAKFGLVAGALIAVVGGILIPVGKLIINDTVEKEAVLENGTTAFDNWGSTGATVYRQFWLFDVQNPQEVINGAPPVVVEKGPYTYRTRYLPKKDINFNDNLTISYALPLGAIFEPSMSVGPEEDNITCLNLLVAGAYSMVPEKDHFLVELLIKMFKLSLFQRRTVKELLWGYKEVLIDEIGLFVPYNGSIDGPYNVFTGKDSISKVGLIDNWKGQKNLDFWDDQYCNMINGTDASSFPPFMDKTKPLYFFSSDICRSVSASFVQSLNLKGIEVFRFTLQPNTLAAPTDNPDNQCYCRNLKVTKNCTVAGALDISSCQNGTPIYISLPHFLHGSSILTDNVRGLNPIEEQHMTYLDVEPITGFTLRFAKRIQINMMYGPSKTITVLKKVKDYTILPIAWLNETAELDQETADMFKEELFSRIQMLEIAQYSLLGVGLAIFAVCLIIIIFLRR